MEIYKSYSAEDTKASAASMAKRLKVGDVVALSGDLGAGKTVFVRGVAEYFGIYDGVSSPTYTLVNQYDGDATIYHFDVYRLENPSEDDAEWIDEYLFGDGICIIEWAENINDLLPENAIKVEISKADNNDENNTDYREIKICWYSE